MAYPISDVPRRIVYSGSAGVGPYAFTFEVLAATDIAVYKNATLLTLTTNYTVSINAGTGTGTVTLLVAATAADTVTIVGDRAIQRTSDFVTGGDLFANTLNDELDAQTIYAQQVDEKADRAIKSRVTDPTTLDMTLPAAASRANKLMGFTGTGTPAISARTIAEVDAAVSSFVNATGNNAASILYDPPGITGTAQAGASTTITLASGASATDDAYNGWRIEITSGTGSGQVRTISDYVGATKVATVSVAWATTPDATSVYNLSLSTTVQAKLRETVSVKDFGAVGDGVTDDTAAIQAAIDAVATLGGGIVHLPAGTYGLSDCVIIRTSQGITLQGDSMVTTIIQSLSASHSTHNALIAVDIQPMNGAIKNLRLRTGNAGFTGWGIVAGVSTTGKNLFSTEIANIWCDFATNSAGFFLGGLYDCWIHDCQFENLRYRFKLEGSLSCGNRNIFSDINDIGGRNPFLETPALQSTGMMFNNITVSTAVGQAVLANRNWWLDVQNADGYVISNIRYESGSNFDPATSYTGFIRLRNCQNMLLDGCVVEVDESLGTSGVSGLFLSDVEAVISDMRMRNNSVGFARVFAPLEIAGTSNRLKFNNLDVIGAESNQINFTGSAMAGSVEFVGCTFTKSKTRLVSDTNANHTMDVRFKDCTLINAQWGAAGASTDYIFVLGTSGATEFVGCTIGRDAEGETANASNPGTIFRLTGTGTGKIEACTVQRLSLSKWNFTTVTQRLPSSIMLADPALADDGTIDLPNRTSGIVNVQCGDEAATFVFGTTAGSVTKVAGTTNTIASNTDTNLCAYWAGANTIPTISNRLGAANRIAIRYEFT